MVHLGVNGATTLTVDEKKSINLKISKLVKICFEIKECPSSSALDQFFASLGSMVRNLSKKNQTSKEIDNHRKTVTTIENTTKELIENARNKSIPLLRIENFAYAYLYACYNKNREVPKLAERCSNLFNLTNCQPAEPVSRT